MQTARPFAPMRRGSFPSPHVTRAASLAELENLRLGPAGLNKLASSSYLLNIPKSAYFFKRLDNFRIQEKENEYRSGYGK